MTQGSCPQCGGFSFAVQLPAAFSWNGKDIALSVDDLASCEFPVEGGALVVCEACDWTGTVRKVEHEGALFDAYRKLMDAMHLFHRWMTYERPDSATCSDECGCLGWDMFEVANYHEGEVQRCDSCEQFPKDEEALVHAVKLLRSHTLERSITIESGKVVQRKAGDRDVFGVGSGRSEQEQEAEVCPPKAQTIGDNRNSYRREKPGPKQEDRPKKDG